jgi:enoyl-CoA hydratase/carnithine racemase
VERFLNNLPRSDQVSDLILEHEDGIAVISLARPPRRNAITLDMWRRLPLMVKELEQDPRVRGIVVTGSGEHFSAGADITEFGKVRANAEQAALYESVLDDCCDTIFATPKPTVAAIRGACMGGACNVAMSCDFRIAEPAAMFGIPAARLSIVYSVKGMQRLLALVGLANAKRILYSADNCQAADAFRIGLIDQIAPEPLAAAVSYLQRIARNAPLSIAGSKTVLNALAMGSAALDPEVARSVTERAAGSRDYRESLQAFVEKREPVFEGR